jgi:hypothetical protein
VLHKIKSSLLVLILIGITACSLSIKALNGPAVTGAKIENNQIVFSGDELTNVTSISTEDSALAGYSFEIASKTATNVIANVLHTSGVALTLVAGNTYNFLVSSANASTPVAITISSVPSGAIMAFQGACPVGWTQVSGTNGRVLVGAGTGNMDSFGSPLTSRTVGATGGAEYTTGIPASTAVSTLGTPSPLSVLGLSSDPGVSGSPLNFVDSALTDTTIAGPSADSNMPPYLVVRYCSKN